MTTLLGKLIKLGTGYQKVKAEVLHWHELGLSVQEISDKLGLAKQIVSAVLDTYRGEK